MINTPKAPTWLSTALSSALLLGRDVWYGIILAWPSCVRTILAVLAVTVLLAIVYIAVYRLWFHPLASFPGPPLCAVSYLPFLVRDHILGSGCKDVLRWHLEYGPIVRVGPNHLSFDGAVAWPEAGSPSRSRSGNDSGSWGDFEKAPNWLFESQELTIMGATDATHRRIRGPLSPAFSDRALRQQEGTVARYVDLLLSKLGQAAATQQEDGKGSTIDIVEWFIFFTFDVIGDMTFSQTFHCLDQETSHPWVRGIFDGIRGSSLYRFLMNFPGTFALLKKSRLSADVNALYQNRVDAVRMAQERLVSGNKNRLRDTGTRDFINYMTDPPKDGQESMTTQELLLSTSIIIVAGSETTATALAGLVWLLHEHPVAYCHLTREIRSAFASEAEIDFTSSAQLAYLDACIKETLRVYPPAAETAPRMSPGYHAGEKWIPAGTRCSAYQWVTFRNPRHFHEPDSFRPERWLPASHPLWEERFGADNRAMFKPFSHGPRNCLGKNLARLEMRLLVARLLFRFDVRVEGGQEGWMAKQRNFVVWEKGPLYVKLRAVEGRA